MGQDIATKAVFKRSPSMRKESDGFIGVFEFHDKPNSKPF